MPLFVITGYDVADSKALRQSARSAHLTRLNALDSEDRLIMAGPMPTTHLNDDSKIADIAMTGSLIIADFTDLASAQAWVADEPYLKAGVYSHVDIKPFTQVYPAPTPSTHDK